MKRNKFSLSHYKLLTCDMGLLVPIACYEVVPGDTIQMSTSALIRMSPLVEPVMHPVVVRINSFFVPSRLLYRDWETFITGEELNTHPYLNFGGTVLSPEIGDLSDYLGIVPATYTGFNCNALPFRAYWKIWNEYFRDQDLENEVTVNDAGGSDTTIDPVNLAPVNWEKDYFTTARPWPDKGQTITIPSVTEVDLEDLRLGAALKRFQEARAEYGSRYVEYLRHCMPGVRLSDARLQNPEYLGGGRALIQFSEVLATAEGTTTEVGDLSGHGISAMRSNRWRRFFEEHGWVLTLMSVVPKHIINTSMQRHWFRTVNEDYFTKELQFIGEQEVYNKEVYPSHTTPGGTFGYQRRYDDYKSLHSGVAGQMRLNQNKYHYVRELSSDPALNSSFINCVPSKRAQRYTADDSLWVMANHSIQARRMMAKIPRPKTF